jgi:hemolysin III
LTNVFAPRGRKAIIKGERFNSISHLVGVILAVGGAAALTVKAASHGDAWKIASVCIYGATLVALYFSSALYHSLKGIPVLRKLDHVAIYLLIAGSYTPFSLVTLRGPLGWTIFGAVWGLAALGIVVDLLFADKRRILPVVIYLFMGWIVVFALKPLLRALPADGFRWLLGGGLLYTTGVIFYALENKLPHSHGIWHLFVLGGSIAQFISIFAYVL